MHKLFRKRKGPDVVERPGFYSPRLLYWFLQFESPFTLTLFTSVDDHRHQRPSHSCTWVLRNRRSFKRCPFSTTQSSALSKSKSLKLASRYRHSLHLRMAPHNDIEAFHEVLRSSRRILALCGAGLSASSGLPTFRGPGGYWRNHDATKLATLRAFRTDPGLVWLFYGYRRHMSSTAQPNNGHKALAALAKENTDFLCLTQNVDGELQPSRSTL